MRQLIICLVLIGFMTGCAQHVLKAPCNASGSNCWPRTKINQWDNDR